MRFKHILLCIFVFAIAQNLQAGDEFYFDEIRIDLKEKNFKVNRTTYDKKGKIKKKDKDIGGLYGPQDYDNQATLFGHYLNDTLVGQGIIDTNNTKIIEREFISVKGKITYVEINYLINYQKSAKDKIIAESENGYEKKYRARIKGEFTMYDKYEDSLTTFEFNESSGTVLTNYPRGYGTNASTTFFYAEGIYDALVKAQYEFIESSEFKQVFENEALYDPKAKFDLINLNTGNCASTIQQAVNASVTIKLGDSHGSGAFISSDGYVITNYHVINGDDSIKVILGDDTELDAELVRYSKKIDAAILKVDVSGQTHFCLSNMGTANVGKDIYAIGTPATVELGQTLSKGIVSNIRHINDVESIQTDVRINRGNSGGPLTDKQGAFYGIVNSKLIGLGIEGIAFGISVNELTEGLNIQ